MKNWNTEVLVSNARIQIIEIIMAFVVEAFLIELGYSPTIGSYTFWLTLLFWWCIGGNISLAVNMAACKREGSE